MSRSTLTSAVLSLALLASLAPGASAATKNAATPGAEVPPPRSADGAGTPARVEPIPTEASIAPWRFHYENVEAELRAADISHLTPDQRAARARAIDMLAAYHQRADFGRNTWSTQDRRPVFVDRDGRRCAVAHLLDGFGEHALVERIALRDNFAYVYDLADEPQLLEWLDRVGLSPVEAARIQGPSWGSTGPTVQNVEPSVPEWSRTATTNAGASVITASGNNRPARAVNGTAPSRGPTTSQAGSRRSALDDPMRTLTAETYVESWWIWWEMNKLKYLQPNRLEGLDPESRTQRTAGRYHFSSQLDAMSVRDLRSVAIPLIREHLDHGAMEVRARAVVAYGRLAGDEAVDELLHIVRTDNANKVRDGAILALGATGSMNAARALLDLADDGRLPGMTGQATPLAQSMAYIALGLGRRHGMAPMLDGFVDELVHEMDPDDFDEVGTAALVYRTLVADADLADYAVLSMDDEDAADARRCRAAESIGQKGDTAQISKVMHHLTGNDLQLRRSAALALGDLGHPLILPRLETAAETESEPIARGFLCLSIGEQGTPAARDFLAMMLEDGPRQNRAWAVLGLGILARQSDDDVARRIIREGLEREANHDLHGAYVLASGIARDTAAVEDMRERLVESAHPHQRMFAALSLAMVEDAGSRQVLRQRLGEEPWPYARVAIAQALGYLGETEDAPAILETMAELRNPNLQSLAAVAVGFHGSTEAVEGLIALLEDPDTLTLPRASAVDSLGLILDEQPGMMLAEVSSDSNFTVFPRWVDGVLMSFTL